MSSAYHFSEKILCTGNSKGPIDIERMSSNIGVIDSKVLPADTKGSKGIIDVEYTVGDRLKFTGTSGIYTSVITDIPSSNKTITFNFVACTDGDGNNYPIEELGNQIWMAENLKTTRYNDLSSIPNVTDGLEWAGLITPAYCWYNNNINYKDVYGALYNWYAVKTGNLCPSGWHVPADDEWHQLVLFLDPDAVQSVEESEIAGGKLKEEGTAHWASPNSGATNEAGFTALPAGYRKYTGDFSGPGGNGNWRTASEYDPTHVWYRYIFYYSGYIYRNITNMQAGFSVRCVMN